MRPSLVLLATLSAMLALPAHAAPLKFRPHAVEARQAQSVEQAGELHMIQLQSVMSQRQMALQLTTNMLQSQHESSRRIIGNIEGGCGDDC